MVRERDAPRGFPGVVRVFLGRFLKSLGEASSKRDPSSSPPLPMKSEVLIESRGRQIQWHRSERN